MRLPPNGRNRGIRLESAALNLVTALVTATEGGIEMALPVRRNHDLAGWNPFRELDDLHDRMSRLLESSFGDSRPGSLTGWVPVADVEERRIDNR